MPVAEHGDRQIGGAVAVGALFAELMPALVQSGALTQEAALEIFDDAIAELLPATHLANVSLAVGLIEDLRRKIVERSPAAGLNAGDRLPLH